MRVSLASGHGELQPSSIEARDLVKRYPAPTRRGAEVEARLDLVAEIYGLTGGEKVRRIGALAERFEIGRFMEQRARSL